MGQDRGAAHPCCGTWHRDSLESDKAGTAGPETRTSELVCLLPSSSSSASPAVPFPLLSTCSWSRARQSWGQRVLPRLQRGAAGSDLEVASLGGSQGILPSRAMSPAQSPRKGGPQAAVAATSRRHCPGGTYWLLTDRWLPSTACLPWVWTWMHPALGTWGSQAAPWVSLPWCQGEGFGGKAAGVCGYYLGSAMTKASLKRKRSLFFIVWPWVTLMPSWSSCSGDAGMGTHCCTGPGSSLQSRQHRA